MLKSISFLALFLALGLYGARSIATKAGPFAATAAFAEDNDSEGAGDAITVGSDEQGDDAVAENSDDDGGAVGAAAGMVFKDGITIPTPCKLPPCEVKKSVK